MKTLSLTLLCLVSPLWSNSLPSERRKNGPLIQEALSPVQVSLQECSAVFYNNKDARPFIYGTVVSADGLVLTKASELEDVSDYSVRVGTKKYRTVNLIAQSDIWDVALVRVDATDLTPVVTGDEIELAHGTWVVSNGATERRFRRPRPGIVSANKRMIKGGSLAVLGVYIDEEEGVISLGAVTKKSGAEAAGLQEGDQLLTINGHPMVGKESFLEYITEKAAGDVITVGIKRGEEILEMEVELMARHKLYGGVNSRNDRLSGGGDQQSPRRDNFPMVIQHDTMMSRRTVGGPIFSLNNEFVGMNIASANRVEAFAIPGDLLAGIVEDLKQQAEKD